jgi:hypothetical protein
MFKPPLPAKIILNPFDTSYEFAQVNFPGWWDEMRAKFGYSEIALIDYVSELRASFEDSRTPHSSNRNPVSCC